MANLRVWAPQVEQVELLVGEQRETMISRGDGVFELDSPALVDGARYALSLDGGPPLPDARSSHQPDGVHARSAWVDHSLFQWKHAEFRALPLAAAVIYELHIGSFSAEGTFDGAQQHLEHLVDLGVTHVEVMPVAAFPGRAGWGYDGVNPFAPLAAYGGPDGFKRFVDACHGRGLAVILDVVYNHLGPSGNYLGQYGPYFTSRYQTPWGQAVNFDDAGSDEVRRYFLENLTCWYRDYQVDGLRLDAVHAIFDSSATHILEALAVRKSELEREMGKPLILVAESDLNDPRLVRAREVGGYGLDAAWCDDLHHALHTVVTGEKRGYYSDFGTLAQLARVLRRGYVFDGSYSTFRQRSHGRSAADLPGERFVACLQNHDQIGNRALGERITHVFDGEGAQRLEQVKVAITLLLTSPFVPLLFQGEEWASSSPFPYFTDFDDAELAEAVRRGRRSEFSGFGWSPEEIPDPQAPSTFESARLDWSERGSSHHAGMLEHYRSLIRLRRTQPELRGGPLDRVEVSYDESARWLIVRRDGIEVIANFGDSTLRLPCPASRRILLRSRPGCKHEEETLCVPGPGAVIVGD